MEIRTADDLVKLATWVNADNYFDYIGLVGAAAVNVTIENIKYGKL